MRVRTAALVLALGALLAALAAQQIDARGRDEIPIDRSARGSFSLVDHTGRRVNEADLRGRFLIAFFGYTFCPDVCPTDLQTIGTALNALGKAGERVQPIFITLDPERDTTEVLARYVRHFHPRFLGLTGTPEAIALAAQAFGVIHVKVMPARRGTNAKHGDYVVDHSAVIYLLGPDGRFLAAYRHGISPGNLAAAVSKHLKGGRS
ncbi:MAG: SCO family protein [Betaproteobacteria bacterium]|nr:SCO family protein [Betaproteobacteria bacterium]